MGAEPHKAPLAAAIERRLLAFLFFFELSQSSARHRALFFFYISFKLPAAEPFIGHFFIYQNASRRALRGILVQSPSKGIILFFCFHHFFLKLFFLFKGNRQKRSPLPPRDLCAPIGSDNGKCIPQRDRAPHRPQQMKMYPHGAPRGIRNAKIVGENIATTPL